MGHRSLQWYHFCGPAQVLTIPFSTANSIHSPLMGGGKAKQKEVLPVRQESLYKDPTLENQCGQKQCRNVSHHMVERQPCPLNFMKLDRFE